MDDIAPSLSGLSSLKNRSFSRTGLDRFGPPHASEQGPLDLQEDVEDVIVSNIRADGKPLTHVTLDVSDLLNDAAAAIVDDSFLRCFKRPPHEPWNWNVYLFPAWAVGVVFRNLILFPLRLVFILLAFLLFIATFTIADAVVADTDVKGRIHRRLSQYLAQSYVASWSGVIKFHGPRPVPTTGRVYVANHTSMIDYAILCSYSPFAAIMQLHSGWVGHLQRKYLTALGCLWFDRTQSKDRALVARRMREHVNTVDVSPLLIFPEGTCVNNEYCVMFKRGAFDLGATVCPIAIRYNKAFANAFWNSKQQSFSSHLIELMRSWALVCDVYFLEPQAPRPGESAQRFAERVQRMIADTAGLRIAPWDGYLKYYNLAEKHPDLIEKQRMRYSSQLRSFIEETSPRQDLDANRVGRT